MRKLACGAHAFKLESGHELHIPKECLPPGMMCDASSMYIADHLGGVIHRVGRLDLSYTGSTSGLTLQAPAGLAVTTSEVYVADSFCHCIGVFCIQTLRWVRTFGSKGAGPGELMYPEGIAIDDEASTLIVADSDNQWACRGTQSRPLSLCPDHSCLYLTSLELGSTLALHHSAVASLPSHSAATSCTPSEPWKRRCPHPASLSSHAR